MMLLQHPMFLSFFPLLFLTVFLYKCFSSRNTSGKNLPPSPPRFPVIGNLHQVSLYPHLSLASLAQKHGPLMLLYFGRVPVLVVSSADAAKQVMKTHDLVFSDRPDSSIWSKIFYNGKDVAFAPYSEYWRQVKSTCVLQLLSNKRVQSFHKVREEEVALMIKKIQDCGSKPVDLSELIVRLTSEVISRIALGKKYSISTGESGKGDSFKELFGEIAELIGNFSVGDYIPWLYWIDSLSGLKGKVEKAAKEVDVFLEGVIRDHMIALDTGTANQDFVYILLEIQKQNSKNGGFSIDKDSVKGAILNMFFDGTDTTAAALEWAMTNLIKNPIVMNKLQKEVREIGSGKSSISEDDLEKMHYLKAVMKESMRINIPVPLLVPREARQDAKVMGYDIKSGTQVLINAWVIARDPSLWDNPEEFQPERFLNSPIDHKGLHFEFLPFGAGRRGCPGIQYAMAINELAVANIVHKFDFALPNGERMEDLDMTGTTGMTVHKKSPLLVIATPHIM